ncbi:outer membrane protein assembly factor BamB family protein [Wenjunlia tyrosinilytica]|uniref:Protein kinase domain-containing protein n=1 Tax=Wenjunlia tyrosinilytica TaxID=1544741 RepID=A0A917ZWH4_9ACTN|nr:serine/threonine-protein kinase [Wenjunlia tyrosinilytica]GGO93989.1 hypothetical protein GCM10012280_47750 [Wenjunlia tyrosinilytica]
MVEALEAGDPRRVGPYRIMGRLGAGGMGQVYLGRSPGGRAVAVKVIRPELAGDPLFRERFAREAAAAQAVSGAFTAAVVGADPHGDPPWLATVYVPGVSLSDAITQYGPLPESSVLALGAGLAEALQAIHSAGLVHRDLKPSNVLLAPDGPKVIDFGIAVTAESSALTHSGVVVGTPGFMSPEQLTGRPVGALTDVFALGSVLAFAATGQGPFGAGSVHALGYRIVHEEPDLSPVPPGVRPLVARCLSKEPAARPPIFAVLAELAERIAPRYQADDRDTVTLALRGGGWLPARVADAVGDAAADPGPGLVPGQSQAPLTDATVTVSHGPDASSQPPGGTPGGPNPSRRRLLIALAGTTTVAAAGLAGMGLFGNDGGSGSPSGSASSSPPATRLRWKFATGGAVAPAMVAAGGVVYAGSKDGSLYALDAASGEQRWQFTAGNGVYSSPAVAADRVYIGSADYNLYAVDTSSGRKRWQFTTGDEVNSSPAVNGAVVYFGSDDRHLYAVDTRTHTRKWRFATGGWVRSSPVVAWGTVYVGSKDGSLYAVDAASGAQRWRFRTEGDVKSSPAVADRVVYVGSYDGHLYAVDCMTGARRWKFATKGGVGSSPAVSGGMVYIGSDDGNLYAVDTATGALRWKYTVGDIVYSSPVVADGAVYVGAKDGNLYAVDAATGKRRWRYTTGNDVRSSPAVAAGAVYVGNDDGNVFAVRR